MHDTTAYIWKELARFSQIPTSFIYIYHLIVAEYDCFLEVLDCTSLLHDMHMLLNL
jgi:hypothetical protein